MLPSRRHEPFDFGSVLLWGGVVGVELGARFAPDFVGIPPHVSQEDFRLWERFRRAHGGEYVAFYFDVSLGEGEQAEPGVAANVAAAWRRLTRFRVDVVGDRGDSWDLIELRRNAGPGAIGALQTYSTLWWAGPPDQRALRVLLVTDRMARDAQAVARLAGIEVRLLGT